MSVDPICRRHIQNWQSLIIEIDWLSTAERRLQCCRNLGRLERIFRCASECFAMHNSFGKLSQIIDEGRAVQCKGILRCLCSHAMRVSDLDLVDRRIIVDYSVSFRAANSSHAFMTVGESAAQVGGQHFAIGKFDDTPAIVAVTVLSKVAVDHALTDGKDAVHLLLGIGKIRFNVQVITSDVDLGYVRGFGD